MDAMDMSLDDYINSFQQSKTNGMAHKEESKFKDGRRKQNDEDDDDHLVLQCEDDDYVSLALKNDNLKLMKTEPNDLRNKIIAGLPNSNSQQWRLMHPNIMHSRPAGMPPLVPSEVNQNGFNRNRGNWRKYNYKYRNIFGRSNWNADNNYSHRNNGRIQHFSNNTRSNLNTKNIKIVLEQLKERNPMILYPDVGAKDLTIEATINEQKKSNGFTQFTMPMITKPNSSPVVVEPDTSAHPRTSEAIKTLLGISEMNLRNEMMPALAGKLLNFLNESSSAVHKPQYDMKIQKEIHDIQKKPLLYKCPGGEVVSSDGVGIPNCIIQPKASGVSLNNRFA